jgi:hypothetical protein
VVALHHGNAYLHRTSILKTVFKKVSIIYLFKYFWANAFITLSTHMYICMYRTLTKYLPQNCYVFPKKPNTLTGFEPGLSVPQANAKTTAPHRQGVSNHLFSFKAHRSTQTPEEQKVWVRIPLWGVRNFRENITIELCKWT